MSRQNNKIFKILAIVAVIILLVVVSKNITTSLRIRFTDASLPFLKSLSSVSSTFKKIIPFASLRDENRLLRERVNFLSRRIEEMKILSDENKRLKEIIDFKKTMPYAVVAAQVVGRDPSNWSNSVIIDKGASKGVKQNKASISTKGLVGRVVEVGRYSSKILLISDPNSKVGVVIQRNRQGGILVGRPDGKCKMIYIALDSDAAAGDKIVTAGFGNIFPKDILVGEILKVDKEPGRLYKYAIVQPAQDLSKLEEVLCIK